MGTKTEMKQNRNRTGASQNSKSRVFRTLAKQEKETKKAYMKYHKKVKALFGEV